MEGINIFFLTSYHKDKLNKYNILIDNKKQSDTYLFQNSDYYIYINEIDLQKTIEGEIEIGIDMITTDKIYAYKIKLKQENNKNIYFLFNYKLSPVKQNLINAIFSSLNNGNYIHENLSIYEKFSFFYQYLLNTRDDLSEEKSKQFYFELISTFLNELNIRELLPVDIIISILIVFNQKLNAFSGIIKGKKINLNDNSNIPIKKYNGIYLKEIIICLDNLLNFNCNDKNLILEIIIIYFIQYKNKDLEIILNEKYKKMFISLFHQNKLYYLTDKILDEEISQKIIHQIPEIENIVAILKTLSKNYVSYLKKIDDNIEIIFKEIDKLKSLKGLFQVDFEVSQEDNFKEFAELHNKIFEKQSKKRKHFINFLKIIKKYFDLYNKNDNLNGLCELLPILYFELNLFPKIKEIINLKNEIVIKIRDLLSKKIKNKNITGENIILILCKLRKEFNDDKIFNFEYKKFILKYFIEKCKNNDKKIMEIYREHKIYELFINSINEKNLLFKIIKDEEFDIKNNFIELLPDESNNEQFEIISGLINKIIEKYNIFIILIIYIK